MGEINLMTMILFVNQEQKYKFLPGNGLKIMSLVDAYKYNCILIHKLDLKNILMKSASLKKGINNREN